MSSEMDPSKMKVVDLRQELSQRGLDTKGNKAVLVKRLKEVLEKELKQELPDTSIADTSTEDLDTSQNEETPQKEEDSAKKVPPEKMEVEEEVPKPKPDASPQKPVTPQRQVPSPQKPAPSPQKQAPSLQKQAPSPQKPAPSPQKQASSPQKETPPSQKQAASPQKQAPSPQKQAASPQKQPEVQKEKPQSDTKVENGEHATEESASAKESEDAVKTSEDGSESKSDQPKAEGDAEHKGEKRKRDEGSPERVPKKREKSPIKEDEPVLDEDKVQLSWYDSDLHLQLDKESFLSARPLHEGVFGYAWAGARASHGISSGKIFYEVKLTEELKWEDLGELWNKERLHRERNKNKRYKEERRSRKDSEKKEKEKTKESETEEKMESEEKKPEDAPEKMETDEGDKKEEVKPAEETKPTDETKPIDETKPTEAKPSEQSEAPKEAETPKDGEAPEGDEAPKEDKEEKAKEEEGDKEDGIEVVVETPPLPTHFFRVGFSLASCGLQLGEEKYSYGYESSGRFATESKFEEYGIKFGVGDVVGAFLDVTDEEVTITYTVNGEAQPTAVTIPRSELPEENLAFFPHVLSRNYVFEVNFGNREEPWFPAPDSLKEYVFLEKAEEKVAGPRRPESRKDCEIILMVGLPNCGKTSWVKKHVESNIDKRYTIFGSNFIDRMTFDGEPLKSKFKGRWNILTDRFQKCLNKLIDVGSARRRNYIIDQTNVFPSAQRRKLRSFEGFQRRAVVVVLGDEEQARRHAEEAGHGKDYPDHVVLDMKANMSIPAKDDWVDDILFPELNEEEAKEQVKKYNEAGKQAGYGGQRKYIRRDDRFGGYNRRNDYRGGRSYYDRPYQRFDRRGPPPGAWNRPSGGWSRDRHDNRGPPSGARDWNRSSRGHPAERRDQSGYGRQGSGQGGWRQSWGGGGSSGSHGNWNQQTFGHGGQSNWSKYDNSGGYGSQGGYGGQSGYGSQSGYGQGGYGSNWDYYGQYGQQQQGGWNQGQQQSQPAATTYGAQGYQQQNYSQEAWAQYAQQYAAQQQQQQQQQARRS